MDNLLLAQEWQRLAELDLKSAEHLLNMKPIPIELICYLCQQSAEKNLKGYLVFHDINPPKTHDLNELRKLCFNISKIFKNIADHCSDLTAYATQPRYPMNISLEEKDVKKALSTAKSIRTFVLENEPTMKYND